MKYTVLKDKIEIALPCGKISYISIEDLPVLMEFDSCFIEGNYVTVSRNIRTQYSSVKEKIKLHRAIMVKKFGKKEVMIWQVDHKDRNTLNNTRPNLRLAGINENAANKKFKKSKSGFRGVFINKNRFKKYMVSVANKRMGSFECPIEAAKYYDKLATERWGEFAVLNFPNN